MFEKQAKVGMLSGELQHCSVVSLSGCKSSQSPALRNALGTLSVNVIAVFVPYLIRTDCLGLVRQAITSYPLINGRLATRFELKTYRKWARRCRRRATHGMIFWTYSGATTLMEPSAGPSGKRYKWEREREKERGGYKKEKRGNKKPVFRGHPGSGDPETVKFQIRITWDLAFAPLFRFNILFGFLVESGPLKGLRPSPRQRFVVLFFPVPVYRCIAAWFTTSSRRPWSGGVPGRRGEFLVSFFV